MKLQKKRVVTPSMGDILRGMKSFEEYPGSRIRIRGRRGCVHVREEAPGRFREFQEVSAESPQVDVIKFGDTESRRQE